MNNSEIIVRDSEENRLRRNFQGRLTRVTAPPVGETKTANSLSDGEAGDLGFEDETAVADALDV
jgi:hypothetical protein